MNVTSFWHYIPYRHLDVSLSILKAWMNKWINDWVDSEENNLQFMDSKQYLWPFTSPQLDYWLMWSETNLSSLCLAVGSKFWLFRDLSLQEGYPQPLSALRMGESLAGADDDDDEEAAAGRWGLVWDPEEGPVWGNMGNATEEKQEDTWTQLLREGVSGITTNSNGEDRNCVWCIYALKRKNILIER